MVGGESLFRQQERVYSVVLSVLSVPSRRAKLFYCGPEEPGAVIHDASQFQILLDDRK
jgi:hypothetical protein